ALRTQLGRLADDPRQSTVRVRVSFLSVPGPSRSALFPYTTLFRSKIAEGQWYRYAPSYVSPAEPLFRSKIAEGQWYRYAPSYVRSEERFSRNAETDLVCRLLLEKKK